MRSGEGRIASQNNETEAWMITLEVGGMSCGHCAASVTRSIQDIDPRATVRVDLAHGKVEVESALPRVELARAISEAGYEVAAQPG